jgi:hypothetical protein
VFGPVYTSWNTAFNYHPALAHDLSRLVHVVSTAKNHAADRGAVGITSTLAVLRAAGLSTTGTRDSNLTSSLEHDWVAVVRRRGWAVGFIGCTDFVNSAAQRVAPGVHDAVLWCHASSSDRHAAMLPTIVQRAARRDDLDALVVTAHLHGEYTARPSAEVTEFARKLLDAGAALVLIMHAHRLQGWQPYDNGLAVYSLASLIADQRPTPQTPPTELDLAVRTSAVLTVDLQRAARGRASVSCVRFTPLCLHRRAALPFVPNATSTTRTLIADDHLAACSREAALAHGVLGSAAPLSGPPVAGRGRASISDRGAYSTANIQQTPTKAPPAL